MASATGIPGRTPNGLEADGSATTRETEPLLGRPGDAAQHEGAAYWTNLTLGMVPRPHDPRTIMS